jgi:hypothetical protein
MAAQPNNTASGVNTNVFYKTNSPEGWVPALVLKGYVLKAVTGIAADVYTDRFTKTAHTFTNGTLVTVTGIGSLTGITSGSNYYVINAGVNDFQLSATLGGSPLDLGGASTVATVCTGVASSGANALSQNDSGALSTFVAADLLLKGAQNVKLSAVIQAANITAGSTTNTGVAAAAVPTGQWFATV